MLLTHTHGCHQIMAKMDTALIPPTCQTFLFSTPEGVGGHGRRDSYLPLVQSGHVPLLKAAYLGLPSV